jgi:hypothetical protein
MDNMLLCGDGKIRLCDFRRAFFKDYAAEMRPIHTMWYAAPYRAVHWNGPLDIENDYFALGVSIWELFTERRPFEEIDDNTVWKWIREGNVVDLEEITYEEASKTAKTLISPMLQRTLSEGGTAM